MNPLNLTKKEIAFQKQDKAAAALNILPHAKETNHKGDEAYMAYLAAIVESSDDAIISKSLDGTITSWNSGGEKMFGYAAKEAVGKNISMIIPREFVAEEKSILERIRNNETIDHFETMRVKKNGERFYVSLTVSPLKDPSGIIIGISKIARDISRRKRSEAAMFLTSEKLAHQNLESEKRAAELVIANEELGFQNKEKEKRAAELVIANEELAFQNNEKEKRAAELAIANTELAFQNDEKENRAAELIIANKELAYQNDEKEKRASELIVANHELIIQNEEKENLAAELLVANKELAYQNNEKEKRATELIKANTDLKISKGQIQEANKELESFSYSVSHDLRAPLRAINGYTNMLKANFERQLDPEANRLMSNIVRNAKKMGQLIDDLLTFSRVGRRELVKMNIPMQQIVDDVCADLRNEQGDRKIEFHINKLLPALADNMAIKQVWLNLIANAVKYTKLKDTAIIEIGSEAKEDEIIYYIKDNGAGFDMRYAAKLFGVFQRLHSDEEFEGTGVGLALVHRIISKHGGRIWAEAKVNEGAIFHFTLNKS